MVISTTERGAAGVWGPLGAVWGLGGVVALLSYAIVRLSGMTVEAFDLPFDWRHWGLLVVFSAFMAAAEGYRGFQKAYSPRVVARARAIRDDPTLARVVLAPLFCMGFFDATRRRLVSTYALTAAIVALVVTFQSIEQPWRGVLDAGVVVGLVWGVASIGAFAVRAFLGGEFDHSPELSGARARRRTGR